MTTSYPTDLDALTNPTGSDTMNNPSHSAQHANSNDAIEALEAKVGKDSSAVTTSHDYKLSGVAGSDKAVSRDGTETLTNKTFTTPKVDTINEETAGNGVTVDSLNIKDGKLNTNDSVVAANITDAIITNAKLSTATGEIGAAWQSWTPTWTNVTIGNATVNARYRQIGKSIEYRLSVVWGTTTSSSGGQIFSLPVTAHSDYIEYQGFGNGTIFDATFGLYDGNVKFTTTTTASLYTGTASVTNTVPMTWTTGDKVLVTGIYEAA